MKTIFNKKTFLLGSMAALAYAGSVNSLQAQSIDDAFFTKVRYRGAFDMATDWTSGWANFAPDTKVYGNTTVTVPAGDISTNVTWTKNNVYLLDGWVYVTSGATLTIEAGTVIRGDKANKGSLIVEPGGKIIANGTAVEPIVFTSNQSIGNRGYGDWGGLILCGNAKVNKSNPQIEGGPRAHYGGTNDTDNSGVLRYVRIEFAGIAFQPDKEINGLTLAAIGSGTEIEYIQISYSGDDSFEWFGGTVNLKHIIAFRGWDDDFDTDYGYRGHVQFAVTLRDPAIADPGSGSNGFESDNDGSGSTDSPVTHPVFSNVSMFGPIPIASATPNSNHKRGMHLRRNSEMNIYNSLFCGYLTGMYIEGPSITNAKADKLQFRYSVMAGNTADFGVASSDLWNATDEENWYKKAAYHNELFASHSSLEIMDPFNLTSPNFLLKSTSKMQDSSYWHFSNPTIGIAENGSNGANALSAYPNPTTGVINFKGNIKIESVSVYNNFGQMVKYEILKSNSLDISDLENRIYVIRVTNESGDIITERVVKQ